MEIEIKGHSGCGIEIVREGDQLFILKQTSERNYCDRLLKQANKQVAASQQEFQFIRVPEITEIVQKEGFVQLKMEYIYSNNYIDHFETSGFEQINYFVKAMVLFIKREIESSVLKTIQSEVLVDKFKDVRKRILTQANRQTDEEIKGLLQQSEIIFENLPASFELPIGTCHGDLTFSNILFNGNNCYLIDFLDSFIESPLMDMVKIRQDSAYNWSTLMYDKHYDVTRLSIIAEKIDIELNRTFKAYDWYVRYYDIFQLMNFLRILQYAQEEKVILYLKKIIAKLIQQCHSI